MDYLRIRLESDLCAASGESSGNAIDNDICVDSYGLPYIPARRIKGCLRASAEELLNLGAVYATNETIESLFGNQYGQEGALHIMDGNMSEIEALKEALIELRSDKADVFKKAAHPSNVVNLFTNVLGQTKLDNGVKVDNTLRVTRVLNHYDSLAPNNNLAFFAPIELNYSLVDNEEKIKEIQELFDASCKALRHMGLNRARGLGNITVEWIHENVKESIGDNKKINSEIEALVCDNSDVIEIPYFISLDAPVSIPGVDGYETEIPGRSVIGSMAGAYLKEYGVDLTFRNLFLDGSVKWSPLTPVISGKIAAATPMMLMELKNGGKRKINRYTQTGEYWTAQKPKTMDGTYAVSTSDGFIISAPLLQTAYHHSVSKETLYTQNALQNSMIYGGKVFVSGADKKLAFEVVKLLQSGRMQFGRSKGAQYSTCNLKRIGTPQVEKKALKNVDKNEKLFVVLETDLIVLDNSVFRIDENTVRRAIAQEISKAGFRKDAEDNPLHPDGYIDICSYKMLGGYHAVWQLQKPHIPAVKAGSVYCFISDGGCIPEYITLGEYKQEGFGRCRIFTLRELEQKQNIQKGSIDIDVYLNSSIKKRRLKTVMLIYTAEKVLRRYGREFVPKDKNIPISRLRLMLSEANEFKDLQKRVDTIKTSDRSSENEKGRKVITQKLLRELYGDDTGCPLCKILRTEPTLYEELEKDSEAMKEVEKMWKLPLDTLLHNMHYEKSGVKEA